MFFNRQRPEMRSVKTAVRVYAERSVIPVEKQAARQIRQIYGKRTKRRQGTHYGQDGIIRRQYAKASPNIEAAKTDVVIRRKLLEQEPANEETADGEEYVDAENAVRRHLFQQPVVEEARLAVVQDDSNDGHRTPAVQSGDICLTTQWFALAS